jgi:hypothetical protein
MGAASDYELEVAPMSTARKIVLLVAGVLAIYTLLDPPTYTRYVRGEGTVEFIHIYKLACYLAAIAIGAGITYALAGQNRGLRVIDGEIVEDRTPVRT